MSIDMQSGPQRVTLEAEAFARAAADSTPSAAAVTTDEAARCLYADNAPLTAYRKGCRCPQCREYMHVYREASRQRHERAEAVHGRLRALLRRLPSLDAAGLAVVSAALDDAVDALDAVGGAR